MEWKQKLTGYYAALFRSAEELPLQKPEIPAAIDEVLRVWREAYALWQETPDPDLIDAAIFRINAAEKQYAYLLRQEAAGRLPEKSDGLE